MKDARGKTKVEASISVGQNAAVVAAVFDTGTEIPRFRQHPF